MCDIRVTVHEPGQGTPRPGHETVQCNLDPALQFKHCTHCCTTSPKSGKLHEVRPARICHAHMHPRKRPGVIFFLSFFFHIYLCAHGSERSVLECTCTSSSHAVPCRALASGYSCIHCQYSLITRFVGRPRARTISSGNRRNAIPARPCSVGS